jgi:hypothetical protein
MASATGALLLGSDGTRYNQCSNAKCHNSSNHYQIIQQMYLLRSKGELRRWLMRLMRREVSSHFSAIRCTDASIYFGSFFKGFPRRRRRVKLDLKISIAAFHFVGVQFVREIL